MQFDGQRYYIINLPSNFEGDPNKVINGLKRLKMKKDKTIVKSSLRKTNKGNVVPIKSYTRKLVNVVKPIFSRATNLDEFRRAQKISAIATMRHIIKKHNFKKGDEEKVRVKTINTYNRFVSPIAKVHLKRVAKLQVSNKNKRSK